VVNNGIVLDAPKLDRKAWRERLGIDEDCFAACMVANLTQYKDHATLLEAWRIVVDQLASQQRSAVLLLAGRLHGDGSTHHSAKALAYDLELGSRVRFLGSVDDIAGVLRASDLGVFSSRSESSPNGVLESMAAGLAIAATDEAGIRDAVGPGGQQFLSPIGDAKSMADQILRFANDRELRLTIGLANRRRVEEHFSPQKMTQDTIAIFAEALHIEPPNLSHDSSVRKHHSLAIE
jgi:glycosyltransferase involved in cell wall biosynthesis